MGRPSNRFIGGVPILQANLNHARQAQDLFLHTLAERCCGLGIVAEPYCPPAGGANWLTDAPPAGSSLVAVVWRGMEGSPPCGMVKRGAGYVAVRWGNTLVVAVYSPPSWDVTRFERQLAEIREVVGARLPGAVIVAGDLNAKSASWGCPRTDRRGGLLEEWMAVLGLSTFNVGATSTCVRPQGESIIDVTMVSLAAAHRVSSWRVAAELETLSDHRYIELRYTAAPQTVYGLRAREQRRWSLAKLDEGLLMESLYAQTWPGVSGQGDIDEVWERVRGIV
ncbi:uncharacterized protein LOC112639970 [Camponotus floridanus]|uniref:uncharacterized protein LOC112639970 n=1 Tax=Camponotus floridanus TaxID=104421 RepID=UPI000DC6B294|nr:uncharacterized protein LOC112639970 [Camponotus floridanus]